MKNFSIALATVAVVLAAVALIKVQTAGLSEEKLAESLKNNPQMIIDALQEHQIREQARRDKAAQEALAQYADEINSSDNAPFVGPKDAKVVVVEFFDFSCGYCKRLAPAMEKVMADNKDVKFVFKPLSFVAPVSNYQAKAAIAAANQGKFIEFYKTVLDSKELMNEAVVDGVAEGLGLDMTKYKADVNSEATVKQLDELSVLAQKIQVNGVPTVLINSKHVQTMDAADLQAAIDEAK